MAQNKTDRADNAQPSNKYVPVHQRHWFWPVAAVVALILIIGFFASIFAVGSQMHQRQHGIYGPGPGMMHARGQRAFGGGQGEGDSQNRITGVVTSINGSTFTIAGHGTTNDIETNGSTQYQGGSQPRVNDSVVVFGAISSGKFTATRVVLNP